LQRRVRQFRNTAIIHVDKKEGLKSKDVKVALRTQTPDDLPVVGSLKHYSNVIVNAGHGERNAAVSIACAKLLSQIAEDGKINEPGLSLSQDAISPRRF
jgi:glycine/D-amino acid oxidase-like deaminating enzyme